MHSFPRLKSLLLAQVLIMALLPVIVWQFQRNSGAAMWMCGVMLVCGCLQNFLENRAEKQLDECARKALNQADAICLSVANVVIVAAIMGLLLDWDRRALVLVLSCCLPLEFLLRAILFAVFDKVGIE